MPFHFKRSTSHDGNFCALSADWPASRPTSVEGMNVSTMLPAHHQVQINAGEQISKLRVFLWSRDAFICPIGRTRFQ